VHEVRPSLGIVPGLASSPLSVLLCPGTKGHVPNLPFH